MVDNTTPSVEDAGSLITNFLRDRDSTDALAVATQEGNNLATEGFGRDLREMSYAELAATYGRDVAQNRFRLYDSVDALEAHNQTDSGIIQKATDSALDAAASVYGIAGNTVGAVTVRPLARLFGVDPDRASAVNADLTNHLVNKTRALRSDFANDNSRYQAIQAALDAEDNFTEARHRIEDGQSLFMASLQMAGENFLDTGSRVLQNPESLREVVSGSVGSLAPSAALARGASFATSKGLVALNAGSRTTAIAQTAAIAATIGATEASGTYADTLNEVMQMDVDTLVQSPVYGALLEEGYTPQEARLQLANLTAEQAFRRQLPTATALGLLSSRFEAAPIGVFRGSDLVSGLRTIASQGLEELGQGASGALSQNIAIQENVDPSRDLAKGVGEAGALGLIGGLGQGGVSAAPAAAIGSGRAIVDTISARRFDDPVRDAVAGKGNVVERASNVVAPITRAAVEATAPLARQAAESARNLAAPLTDRVAELATRPDTQGQTEAAKAARDSLLKVEKEVEAGQTSQEVVEVVSEPDTAIAPEGVDTETGSFLQNVTKITELLGTRSFKPNAAQKAYAASQISRLKGMMDTLPSSVQTQIRKVINSPQVRKIEQEVKSIDQNKTHTDTTPINKNTVAETLSVAKTNPTNVNPTTVNKILKESGEQISKQDVAIMQSASRIAAVVNSHADNQVQISTDQHVGLQKLGRTTREGRVTPEQVSRSINATGYTDASGNQLRSINDFASDLFQGAQSVDKKVITKSGQQVSVAQVMEQFSNFVTHMNNKVDALNRSFVGNNEKGTGPRVGWRGLVNGNRFVEESDWKPNSRVAYHRGNPNSVALARRVENDAKAAVQVFNEIRNQFPDQFGDFPEVSAIDLLRDETENPTVLDEETTQEGVSEEQNQNIEGENQNDDTQVVNVENTQDDTVLADQKSSNEETSEGTVDQEPNLEDEVSDREAGIEINQSNDLLVDDNGNVVKFYHGTNALFDTFQDGRIFLTTRKGLAREHARRAESGTPRLIEANVKLTNPLSEQIDNKEDPDAFWLKNALTIETQMKKGGYDSILIFNDKEAMVIAFTDSQVIQTNPDFDNSVNVNQEIPTEETQVNQKDDNLYSKIHESFSRAYQENTEASAVTSLDDFLDKTENLNPAYRNFISKLISPVLVGMNKRLNKNLKVNGRQTTLLEALKDGEIQTFRQYRNTALVDIEIGKYDRKLAELASIAIVDWMTTQTGTDPRRIDDTLEGMGLSGVDLTDEQYDAIVGGVSVSKAVDDIASDVLRMWNVHRNEDATLGEIAGIAEGFVKEFLTVLSNSKNSNLINIVDIPVVVNGKEVTTQTIRVDGLKSIQDQIRSMKAEGVPTTAKEALFGDRPQGFSVGSKITHVANTQNRSDVKLSALEQKALRQMQDTPHFQDKGKTSFFEEAIGGDNLFQILGGKDEDAVTNPILRKTIKGKNLSIIRNLEEMNTVMQELGENEDNTPVYYSVGVTKVGRHQYQGINPQNNKVLRTLVSPTWSEINLQNQQDMNSFWLAIAQAADLMKIEKMAHTDVLAAVQQAFTSKYGEAKDMAKVWLTTGEMDGEAFASLVGEVEPQVLSAIYAVAEMEFARKRGDETLRTSLSVELDGLTNGAANMMVNFGQGEITDSDFKNFNRVGLFLGRIGTSINDYFSVGNQDMYEKTSKKAEANMYQGFTQKLDKSTPEMMKAAANFSAHFGNFVLNEDGQVEMTRNTAKNPMTKVNYGSGVLGVGTGIADDMEVTFYEKIQGIPAGTDLRTYFGYPSIYEDIQILFGTSLPNDLRQGEFVFSDRTKFRKNISDTIGTVLTNTTKEVIGDRITEVNDMMVFSTNVQNQYLQLLFVQRVNELAEQRAKEGKIRRTTNGEPQIADMTRRDYQSIVKEMSNLAPLFISDDQTLAIGSFSKQVSNLVLSTNMDGKLNQKALLQAPDEVGVRAIPYQVIGTGDAMMMNIFFGSDTAPNDVLGIFDGIDVPITKLKEYAQLANEAVLKSWDRDVMSLGVNNFSGFLNGNLDQGLLSEAFQMVRDSNKKTTVTAQSPQELLTQLEDRLKQNRARKAVLKRIPLSVDQMGGSSNPYNRGEGKMTRSQINYEIQKELEGRVGKEEDIKIETQVSTTSAILNNLRMTSAQKKVAEIIKPLLKDVRVVIGTIDQINTFRQENFPDDGQILEGIAQYDAGNRTIFSTTVEASTLLHEMVHAGTFDRVLDHYNGNSNSAVTRLESLMDEFLALDVSGTKELEAKAAILRQKANTDAQSKAAAVNEFMAYALTDSRVSARLQNTQTKTLASLKNKVINLMRRIMGGVPTDMFSQVVFNTKVLHDIPADDDGGNGNGDDGSNGENTPEAEGYTNFWIDQLKKQLDRVISDTKTLDQSYTPTAVLSQKAEAVIDQYRQVGMLVNENARNTFQAIYMVMASEMKLDENSVITLTRVFQHIEENITPEMFGSGSEANQTYSTVISSFGNYKTGDVSDAISVLLALSQTSQQFRNVLDQIPEPEGAAQVDGSLNNFLSKATSGLMRKVMGSIDITDKNVRETMDQLASGLIKQDLDREYRVLSKVTNTLDTADNYVSGALSTLAERQDVRNRELQASTRSKLVKSLSNSVTLGTNLLNRYTSEQTANAAKQATHMNTPILSLVPIRELVSEFIGTDRLNKPLVGLLDEVNSRISGMRQAYREDLPGILQNQFEIHPDEAQWASMHTVLGKSDFTRFIDPARMQQSMALLEEAGRRSQRISELEQVLDATYLPYIAQDAKDKAQQLADFINGNGAGKLLARNAYAIVKNLDGNLELSMVEVIDELVTMYAVDQMDSDVRETTVQLWQNEPKAITAMVNYIQGLNEAEDGKVGISEQARLNSYKGFIPNHGDKDTRIIIDQDARENDLAKRGYKKIAPYNGDVQSIFPRSYYVTTTRQGGAYSQGIMQNVQSTYRGVDINTGLTVTGETSGFISDENAVSTIIDELNRTDAQDLDVKDTLMPVFDEDGKVMGFERAINPDIYKAYMNQDENLAVMLGAWAGRHVEEMLAQEYNRTLVDHLDRIYQEREPGTDDLFVNLKDTKDPIYKESFHLIPKGTKEYIDSKFNGEGFFVLKDHANLSVGYREFSVTDFWSGKTRLPQSVQKAVVGISQMVLGTKAMKMLVTAEEIGQGIISSAKDLIVIRSLVVPAANIQSNVIQLSTSGVPVKRIIQGFRAKLSEVEEYNKNVTKRIELEAKLRLAARNTNQRRIIESQIQVIEDLNSRMSIAPMIAAGAYKNLSEGITDLDVDLSKGRLGDIVDNLTKKLPDRVGNVAKLGLVSKSTKLYQVANRATQYGDFLAKSIYYDHLFEQGLTHDEALAVMNEEFVNFSFLPGRTRSYLETIGLSWFMAFKIRIAKIALKQLRERPVRALAINNLLPDIGSPVQDNVLSVISEGRLDYSTGFEMLFDSPGLNPWVNLLNE